MNSLGSYRSTSILSAAAFVLASAYSVNADAQPAPAPGMVPGYAPPRLEWSKGEPIPPGYTPSTEIRSGFVIAGAVTLGVTWIFGGIVPGIAGTAAGAGEFGVMFVPAVGPFIAMPVLAAASSGSSGLGAAYAILVIDGLAQSTGAALLLYGLLAQRDVLIRNDKVGNTNVKWMPTPMPMGTAGRGFGVVGTF